MLVNRPVNEKLQIMQCAGISVCLIIVGILALGFTRPSMQDGNTLFGIFFLFSGMTGLVLLRVAMYWSPPPSILQTPLLTV
jgi:uncharacterized membrane protein HdeD (DUF308 family)